MSLFNLSSPLSGLAAAATKMAVSADNVARRIVPDSEKNRVIALESATGGVETKVEKIPMTEAEKASDDPDSSNIDYAEELVAQIVGKTAFDANVATANAELGLVDKLLDIKI